MLMRIWARTFKNNRTIKELVVENHDNDTRTHKVFDAIDKIAYAFDISKPIWLDLNINDFKRFSKCRFNKDSFIDEIDFDYLEFQVLDED